MHSPRTFSYTLARNALQFTIHPTLGQYASMPKRQYYRITLHGAVPPSTVTVSTSGSGSSGQHPEKSRTIPYRAWAEFTPLREEASWHYDGKRVALVINLYDWCVARGGVYVFIMCLYF